METMIALALSVVVTSAMVILMANSLGTATRIIHMSQLTDEMRNAVSMMTRDVRRANHTANSIFCYGNSDCGAVGGVAQQAGDIQIVSLAANRDCFSYTLDRNFDGNAANDPVGAFRLVPSANNAGVIEMWTGAAGATPNCGSAAGTNGWIELTDPATVNITLLDVDDAASFSKEIFEDETNSFDNRQRQIQIRIQGELVNDTTGIVSRSIEDIIYVRNDFILL